MGKKNKSMFKKTLKPLIIGMLLAVGFSFNTIPAVAFADANDAIERTANHNNNVWVSPEAKNTTLNASELTSLSKEYAVIVVPANDTEAYDIAKQVVTQNKYDAVFAIGSEGKANTINVASADEGFAKDLREEISKEQNNNDPANIILHAVETVGAKQEPNVPNSDNGFNAAPLGVTGAVVLTLVAGVTAFGMSRKRKKNKNYSVTQVSNKISAVVPEKVQEQLRKLNSLISAHDSHGAESLSPEIVKIVKTTQTLFERIASKQPRQANVAEVEYVDKFSKLVSLLGTDNYLDIVDNPDQWDDSEGRIAKIREATITTRNQINENIKQINASKDLEFQVALGSLIEDANAPTIKDIFKD